jgi:hypothetical protein
MKPGLDSERTRGVGGKTMLQVVIREGLKRLDSHFLELTEAQHLQILTSLSESGGQKNLANGSVAGGDAAFFTALKNLTADGYYTSRVGLLQELGYNGKDYLAAFPAFSIPEH